MQIARIDVFAHELTYAGGTFALSRDRVQGTESSTLVRITTDDGREGWGEACPLTGTYLPSFTGGVRAALELLAPALLGADPRNLGDVQARMDAVLLGQPGAKSPLDVACWDLLGQDAQLPVSTLLGGTVTTDLPLYLAIPMGAPAATAEHVRAGVQRGFRRFQLKVGGDPRRDAEAVRAALDVVGDDGVVVADANGGWSLADALTAVRLLEALPIHLEQPCRTLAECRHVRRATTLPLVYDEVVTDAASLIAAVHDGGASVINLKLGKVGGLSGARPLRDLAVALGAGLTIEDTWGGDVATAAVSHLAASTPAASLFSVSFLNDATLEHAAGHVPRSQAGSGSAPTAPGLGIAVAAQGLGEPVMAFANPWTDVG
jgi:L-alanine-DL-glutamate epimerase-like enolase superfamily enzyme